MKSEIADGIAGSIVVTGAAGFLGSHLCEHYLKNGYTVHGLDNFYTGLRSNIDLLRSKYPAFHFIEKDVTGDWNGLPAISDLKYVFHFASPASPPHYQKLALETLWVNTIGLNNAIQFADKQKARVVFASTSEVYGDPEFSPQPETYWGNVNSFGERSCYDEAKRFGEALIFSHNKKLGTQHGLVRIFNTYGPRMNPNDGRVVINFILQALKNEDLTVYGDGKQTRSFCYVDDLINGISKYAASSLTFPVNLGNDTEFTMLELADVVLKQVPSKSKLTFKDLPSDDPKKRRPDLTLAKKNLSGWKPEVPLATGVKLMAEWLKQQM
jgi:nucleoside-diphosphate-sugar epimerase